MKNRSAWLWLVAFVMLIGLIGQPPATEAQCAVTYTNQTSFPPTMIVTKQLSGMAVCSLVGQNALSCFPGTGVPMSTSFLLASANPSATMSPFCSWTCSCGTGGFSVISDSSDGLPIELLDFRVE